MAETPPDLGNAKVKHDMKDDDLCKKIMDVLGRDGPRRVLLAGEAGIGKTRLAKKVGERVINHRLCFLTLYLHLNNKFDDEWSLYENIASQLSVYLDFEETEVDDRDEDDEEEKKKEELLEDLKNKIAEEIEKKEKALAGRITLELAEKSKKPVKILKVTGKKNTAEGKEKTEQLVDKNPAEGEKKDIKPYLLLILDDEGNKTREDYVMKDLKLEEFLRKQNFLKDASGRLKILVTRRKGDAEPTESAGNLESEDSKTEKGDDETSKPGEEIVSQDTKSEQGDGEKDGGKNDSAHDHDNERETKSSATVSTQVTEPSREITPATGDGSKETTKCYDKIEFNTTDESETLRNSLNETNLWNLFVSLLTEEWTTDKKFLSYMMEKTKNSPAAIFVLAKSLKQITHTTAKTVKEKDLKEQELKEKEQQERIQELKEKIQEVLSADRSGPSDQGSTAKSAINPILCLAYELLKNSFPGKDAILDCFWHSLDFFEHCGCVYYRDLITQWILEGYFDPVRSVEKAYQKGHSILMELINRGMLKIQENNMVVPERAMSNLIDPRRRGHLGRSRLAFSRVYAGDKKKGIGKINQIDDMIKTVQAKKGDKISTLLVSGDRLRRETPEKYFKNLGDLEVLCFFEPTLEPFVSSFSKLLKLRVLVIRDCDLLTDIEELKALQGLNALEVSGASSLTKISDDFFKALTKLQSLHLSELQIKSSPSSISLLEDLHCLIIRNCPLLKDLPDIQELTKLEVVDISGARRLQTCFDNTEGEKKNKSKNKNFYHLKKLQLLDFSESQIERLPIFQDSAKAESLHSVTRLLLRDCSKLRRLPSLKPLSGLQILDLSGTTSLVEMLEVCFEDKKELTSLNLTGTNLSELADTINELTSLKELLLKDCTNLKEIPNIGKLTNLEVIDVSGCPGLNKIEGSFEDMFYLREVNFRGTKMMITPEFLPKESDINIRCVKRFIAADGTPFEGNKWSDVKEAMRQMEIPDKPSSSGEVVNSQEITEKVSEEKGEIQLIVSRARDFTEKGAVSKDRLKQVLIKRDLYKNILARLDTANRQEVMKVYESKDLGEEEALANADSVSFVDINSTRLTSIFNETKSVKSCSLWMCKDIKDLFSGVEGENLGSLEILSITNLPLLETICWGDSCKNLKKLSIECCPNIKTIFTEASQLPSSLEDLHIKYCEKLEKVVEGVELSSLTTLTWTVEHCPSFKGNPQGSGYVIVDGSETTPQV